MTIPFSKYSGCGNDFILIDNRTGFFSYDRALIQQLCHRRTGVGADGVILLELSSKADFKMRIFNADGSEAEMCGNGIRCLVKFIEERGMRKASYRIETMKTILHTSFKNDSVMVEMGAPTDCRWDVSIATREKLYAIQHLNTGVPHAVLFVEEIEKVDVLGLGKEIRHHSSFTPQGTNVTFAKIENPQTLSVRTFERGVEDETLACGTGATAAALAAGHKFGLKTPLSVRTRSEEVLQIDFPSSDRVTMTGPANLVFRGVVEPLFTKTKK